MTDMKRDEIRTARVAIQHIRCTSELLRALVGRYLVGYPLSLTEGSGDVHSFTLVPTEHFDRMLLMLDSPDKPMPRLTREAQRHRTQPRFKRA